MRTRIFALLMLPALGESAAAQQPGLARALDLERQGSYAAAAEAYRAALGARPADVAALLGLERALLPLNRTAEAAPAARAALAAGAPSAVGNGVLVRTWIALGAADSVRAAVDRWAQSAPGDEAPYREWVGAAIGRGDRAAARAGVTLARQRVGRLDALAPEAAQLAIGERDWTGSAHEWLAAIRQVDGFRYAALAALSAAPDQVHADLLRLLQGDGAADGRTLAGSLIARWGDPVGGFRVFQAALPGDNVQAAARLKQFVEGLQARPATPDSRRAEGMAYEALATRSPGAGAPRARMLAAQAYADGGDRESARRMLNGVADDRGAAPAAMTGAAATLIGVLVDEGRMMDADDRLRAARLSLSADEYLSLNRRVAWGWARSGALDRAERALVADSTVEGFAVSGRVAMLRGDILGAVARLRAAGPYTGTREEAAKRASLLALLQRIDDDSLPALGAAFLHLEQGDTAAAVSALSRLAGKLAPDRGGAELRLWTGRLEAARGRAVEAEKAFRAADVEAAPATAPAAELELGRLLIALGRRPEAVATLEHLILTYATSALVPQARRALDEARGAVPRT